ncbi:hypothetical protein GCM10027586_11110 [Kineococcus gypseus]
MLAAAVVLPLALLAAPVASAAAPAAPITCGAEVSGTVVLTEDLTCPGTALVVTESGTTIDLDGHTVRRRAGSSGDGAPGIRIGFDRFEDAGSTVTDVSVGGGRVEGYSRAVEAAHVARTGITRLRSDGAVSAALFDGFSVRDSRVRGVSAVDGDLLVVERNHLPEGASAQAVLEVRVLGNAMGSGGAFSETAGLRYAGNRVRGGAGLSLGEFTFEVVVERNTFTGTRNGVVLSGARHENTALRHNRVRDTRSAGIHADRTFQGYDGIVVEGNRVTGSGYQDVPDEQGEPAPDGILVSTPYVPERAGLTLRGNDVRGSARYGINAAGVVDGGGNRARRNAASPQCIGVVCAQ